jgi:hypothetical protein
VRVRDRFPGLSRLLTVCAASGLVGSCASIATGPLEATATPTALELTNRGAVPIYFMVVERQLDALIDWAPCREPTACRAVPPKGRHTVPYRSVPGYRPDARELLVHWWRLAPARERGARPTIDSVRTVVVQLPAGRNSGLGTRNDSAEPGPR